MNKGICIAAVMAGILSASILTARSEAADEEVRVSRILGPGANLRVDIGLDWTETRIRTTYASGTKTPENLGEAGANVQYWMSSLEIPLKISLELHPYFQVFGKIGYTETNLYAEWLSGSVFVSNGDPNVQCESADLDAGFTIGFGAVGQYQIDVFRLALAYNFDWQVSSMDHQSFQRVNMSGDFTAMTHRVMFTAGTKLRFLTPHIGFGSFLVFANGSYKEHLPAGSILTAGEWDVRYREWLAFFILFGLDAEIGEGTAGVQFRFMGEFHAEFYLGVRV